MYAVNAIFPVRGKNDNGGGGGEMTRQSQCGSSSLRVAAFSRRVGSMDGKEGEVECTTGLAILGLNALLCRSIRCDHSGQQQRSVLTRVFSVIRNVITPKQKKKNS